MVPASAQTPVCGQHDAIAAYLESKYRETLTGGGLSLSGVVIELYVSPIGTWTLTATNPDGTSCLISAGQNWEFLGLARFEAT